MRPGKLVIRIALVLVTLCVLYCLYIMYSVWHWSRVDQAQKADAILVLGAAEFNGRPSPVLKARLDHAVSLYVKGDAPIIVVTGGRQEGDKFTEAGASAAYLAEKGVPDSAVLREVQGRTTWESLKASKLFLDQRDVHSVIFVSDSFHNARLREMAKRLDMDPLVSATLSSPIVGEKKIRYGLRESIALGLGKVVGFDRVAALDSRLSAAESN